MPLLEVRNLRSGYGDLTVLRDASIDVEAGRVSGLFGHNGMGKSTLMRTLMGLLPVKSGSIRYDGEEIAGLPAFARSRRGLGYVPQGRQVFSRLTVRQNMEIGVRDEDGDRRIRQLLDRFPTLERLLDRMAGNLSGGEQQMLAIARALAPRPRLLLLDEPTEGIQPSIVSQLASDLVKLASEEGIAILVVEQNLAFLKAASSTITIMSKGTVTQRYETCNLDAEQLKAML